VGSQGYDVYGIGKVFADTLSNGRITMAAVSLEDRSTVFYTLDHGWERESSTAYARLRSGSHSSLGGDPGPSPQEARMHVRLDRVPHLIETLWRASEKATENHMRWLEQAAREANPELREGWEQLAEAELEVARTTQAVADDLLAQFRSAGGEMHRKH